MEKLLKLAKNKADQAEIFVNKRRTNTVIFENAHLKDIDSAIQSGVALRIIKDDKIGFAYTKNLNDPEKLVQNAVISLKGGVEAPLDFPTSVDLPTVNAYDERIESVSNVEVVEECERICDKFKIVTDGQINIHGSATSSELRIINTQGTNISQRSSYFSIGPSLLYPGGYSSIDRAILTKSFQKTPDELLNYISDTYLASKNEVQPKCGKLKTIFLPETVFVLMWRLNTATSGKSIYQKESPLINKIGKKLFSSELNIYDDPLNDKFPGARSFDDEGTACARLNLVQDGVLKNFYTNRYYAKKLNLKPTGNGYKSAMWGGETVTIKPLPTMEHQFIQTGQHSLKEMISAMDQGIIIPSAMGAHSGNIPNGDFSIGLSPGLYVENGQIIGHVKDVMVAGNIYDVLQKVLMIEDTQHAAWGGYYPAILLDDVSVVTK